MEGEDRPPAASAQAALEKDMHRAAVGLRTGLGPTGDAVKTHFLQDYASKDEWATAVMELLSEKHTALCTEVGLKEADGISCGRCSGGCRRCVFWKAVRILEEYRDWRQGH